MSADPQQVDEQDAQQDTTSRHREPPTSSPEVVNTGLRSQYLNCPRSTVHFFQAVDQELGKSSDPIIRASCVEQNELQSSLTALPQQGPLTARIYICDFPLAVSKGPGNLVLSHLHERGVENIGSSRESDVLDILRLALQWRERNFIPLWFRIKRAESQETSCVAYMQCIPSG